MTKLRSTARVARLGTIRVAAVLALLLATPALAQESPARGAVTVDEVVLLLVDVPGAIRLRCHERLRARRQQSVTEMNQDASLPVSPLLGPAAAPAEPLRPEHAHEL